MTAQNLLNTKSELISAFVQKEIAEAASLMPFVEDFSALAVKGFDTVSIPKLSSFTVQNRAFGAAVTENASLIDSKDSIPLDQNTIVLFGYDAADAMQSSIDYLLAASGRAASAQGRAVNQRIVLEWLTKAGHNVNGGTPADITANDILDMREFLISNYADMTTVTLKIAADQEKAMLKLPEFSRYDYRGNAPLVNGMIGTAYGVPVVINQELGAQQAILSAKAGCGIAFQRMLKFAEQDELDYGSDGKKVVVDATWGVGGMQLGEGTAGAGLGPLIAKLKD